MFNLRKLHRHDYKLTAHIGGDTQANAYACKVCGKKKVSVAGINGKPDYYYVLRHGTLPTERSDE